jgi:hypothetical protein
VAPLTEAAVERLDPAQAADLARVIDLQARWENLRVHPTRPAAEFSVADLHNRQKAYEAFRVRMEAYSARYRAARVAEPTLNTAGRVGAWCRVVAAVFRQAGPSGECPAEAVAKAYRLADAIAARLEREPVGRESPESITDAIRALDALGRWCGEVDGQLTSISRV